MVLIANGRKSIALVLLSVLNYPKKLMIATKSNYMTSNTTCYRTAQGYDNNLKNVFRYKTAPYTITII